MNVCVYVSISMRSPLREEEGCALRDEEVCDVELRLSLEAP